MASNTVPKTVPLQPILPLLTTRPLKLCPPNFALYYLYHTLPNIMTVFLPAHTFLFGMTMTKAQKKCFLRHMTHLIWQKTGRGYPFITRTPERLGRITVSSHYNTRPVDTRQIYGISVSAICCG